ncbi:MAG: flippase-like domain-containing protein [Bacteroidia bacterium]|nr:flippase-like domain-containing protein [Bacteroidia bacterium]
MRQSIRSLIQYAVLLGIGGLLVYLSIQRTNVSKEELLHTFSNANWFWVSISLLISLFSHFARAYRWNYLLEQYNYTTDLPTSLSSVLIGYLANYGLPRMGEISRCAVVNKYNRIPMDIALGTVIAERVVDLFLLFLVFVLVVIFQYNDLYSLLNQYIFVPLHEKFQHTNWFLLAVVGTTGLVLLVLLLSKKNTTSVSWFDKAILFIQNLIRPLLSIHKIKRPAVFWIWSIVIWLAYFFSMYACSLSMSGTEHLGMLKILVLFLFGTIGVIVTPGGIGAYHFLITEILLFYQLDNASAAAFPWMIWGTQFILIIFTGALAFILLPIIHSKK